MEPSISPNTPVARNRSIRWIGGVVRPYRCKHAGKPMRVAAWITNAGSLVGAAIVEGHGPTVLHELLTDLLAAADEHERPSQLVVWPNARSAFAGVEYPPVTVERDDFLKLVLEDEVDFDEFLRRLPVRVG